MFYIIKQDKTVRVREAVFNGMVKEKPQGGEI